MIIAGGQLEKYFTSLHDLKLVLGFFCEGIVGFIREDDVIEERDVEDVAGLAELVRLVDVGHARGGSSARVVVEEDDRCGVAHHRFLDDAPVVDLGRLDGSDCNHLLGQRKIGRVEKEDSRLLVVEVPEVFSQVTCRLGRCFDRGEVIVVRLLIHLAAVLRVKHLSLRCRKRDTPIGHRQDKVENTVDPVGMSGCHNFAA